MLLLRTDHTRDCKRVREGISVLKLDSSAIDQGFAVVDETVVVAQALEHFWVDKMSRAEPAAGYVNSRDVAARGTDVEDFDRVGRNAAREWGSGPLVYHYPLGFSITEEAKEVEKLRWDINAHLKDATNRAPTFEYSSNNNNNKNPVFLWHLMMKKTSWEILVFVLLTEKLAVWPEKGVVAPLIEPYPHQLQTK
ncbi:hypothetical protein GQ457_15G006930 [Hibiscus cannabinus]